MFENVVVVEHMPGDGRFIHLCPKHFDMMTGNVVIENPRNFRGKAWLGKFVENFNGNPIVVFDRFIILPKVVAWFFKFLQRF